MRRRRSNVIKPIPGQLYIYQDYVDQAKRLGVRDQFLQNLERSDFGNLRELMETPDSDKPFPSLDAEYAADRRRFFRSCCEQALAAAHSKVKG